LAILGGIEILLLPLSPIADLVLLGVAGISGALIGVLMVITGLFAWFSPPNRLLSGVFTLVFAVASFVVSNLGGLIVGMVLGVVGGALIVAWTPDKRPRDRRRWWRRRKEPPKPSPPAVAVLILLGVATLLSASLPGRAGAEQPAPPNPPPDTTTLDPLLALPLLPQKGAVLPPILPRLQRLVPPALLAPVQPVVRPARGAVVSGLIGDLRMDTLTVTNFQYQGMVTYPVAGGGTQRALRILLDSTDIGNLRITIPNRTATSRVTQARHARHTTTTTLVLDCTRLRLNLFGVLPVEFNLAFPPPPLTIIPLLYATDVKIDYVRLTTPVLIIPAMRVRNEGPSGKTAGRDESVPGPRLLSPAQSQTLIQLASLLKLPALLRPYGLTDSQARAATQPVAPVPGLPATRPPAARARHWAAGRASGGARGVKRVHG
jgi:hypothetical protein